MLQCYKKNWSRFKHSTVEHLTLLLGSLVVGLDFLQFPQNLCAFYHFTEKNETFSAQYNVQTSALHGHSTVIQKRQNVLINKDKRKRETVNKQILSQSLPMSHKPKSHIFPVHPIGRLQGYVELGAVAMGTLVGHPQDASFTVGDRKTLIQKESSMGWFTDIQTQTCMSVRFNKVQIRFTLKCGSVDRLPTSAFG